MATEQETPPPSIDKSFLNKEILINMKNDNYSKIVDAQ